MKGFYVEIYSNDFVDSLSPIKHCTKAIVIDPELPKIFDVSENYPPLKLVRRELGGRIYIHAEPITEDDSGSFAFGGRFIYTSDSRFREINDYPIPLHDRNMRLEK